MDVMGIEARFARLATNNCKTAETFFSSHYHKILQTVVDYQYLKFIYNKHKCEGSKLSEDDYFIGLFRRFYAMRFVSQDFVKAFFQKMDEIKDGPDDKEYDAVELTYEISGKGPKQFSFITKMLNMHDDRRYPIYDKMIGRACWLPNNTYGTENERKLQLKEWYDIINNVYNYLFEDDATPKILSNFREVFNCPTDEELSDHRIIDIILWLFGEDTILVNRFESEDVVIEKLIKQGYSRSYIIDEGYDKQKVFELSLIYGRKQKEKTNRAKQ